MTLMQTIELLLLFDAFHSSAARRTIIEKIIESQWQRIFERY